MRFEYYPDTDTLYIKLTDERGADAREVAPDTVLDLNTEGHVVGIELEHASKRTDLTRLEITSLPVSEMV